MNIIVVSALLAYVATCAGRIVYDLDVTPTFNGRTIDPVDARVDARISDMEFTRDWFERNDDTIVHLDSSILPCPLPPKKLRLVDGIGYDSTSESVMTANCWIDALHRTTGNLDVDYMRAKGASLVHGAGVSELLFASIVSLAESFPLHLGKPVITSNEEAYYAVLKHICVSSILRHVVTWIDPRDVQHGKALGRPLIIVAVVPNNPLGHVEKGLLTQCKVVHSSELNCFSSPTFVIADHSFMWPCVHIESGSGHNHSEMGFKWPLRPQYSSILLFGLSKLTGHSGVRHGWAWIVDRNLSAKVQKTLWDLGTALSAVAISHSTHIVATIVMSNSFHDWCAAVMHQRWSELTNVAIFSTTYQIKSSWRSAVAIIQCPEGVHCADRLLSVGIMANDGEAYGLSSQTARISVGGSRGEFRRLILRLNQLSRI